MMDVDMDSAKPDPRRNPFTLMEKEYLIDLVEEHKDILDPAIRYNDSMTIYKRKQTWNIIWEKYNKKFKDNVRDIDQLKRLWSKIKIQIKKYMNVPRNEHNLWTLARIMLRHYLRVGREDILLKDAELISMATSGGKDTASSQTESETNGSQNENSTPQTIVSSDDDLIILNVVDDSRTGVTSSRNNSVEVMNDESAPSEFLPITYSNGNPNANSAISSQSAESTRPVVEVEKPQNDLIIQKVIASDDTDQLQNQQILSQTIPNNESFEYYPATSKSSELTGEYSLWQDIHCVCDNITPPVSSINVVTTKTSSRRQHRVGSEHHLLNRGRVRKIRPDYYNRYLKRTTQRLRTPKRLNQLVHEDEPNEADVRDGPAKEEDYLSESSYRKRLLSLAEEEHAQKMQLLKLKCEVVELQKQELANKLNCKPAKQT